MNGQHEDAILHLRTAFARAGHDELDVVAFASGVLRSTKLSILRQLSEVGFVGKRQAEIAQVELGDPAAPVVRPVAAYINWSRWLARCECGGVEYVDLERPIFMCCSCWNAADGYAWRTVSVPAATAELAAPGPALGDVVATSAPVAEGDSRDAIETALLARADPRTRNWNPEQTVTDLELETADANLAKAVS